MTIAIGIVAHDSRLEAVRLLRRSVAAVVTNVDDGSLGCEANHIAVLRALAYRHVDWCVVLEDDAQPVKDFRAHLAAALAFAPAPIVGLYLGYGNPSGETQRQSGNAARTAISEGKAWIVSDCLIGSVGYALRIRMIEPLLRDIETRGEELPLRISRWAQARSIGICYTQPSLVDHADGEPIDCSMGARPRGERKAWNCGIRHGWDTGAVRMGHCPGWSAPR
jgi:hypothetical protein